MKTQQSFGRPPVPPFRKHISPLTSINSKGWVTPSKQPFWIRETFGSRPGPRDPPGFSSCRFSQKPENDGYFHFRQVLTDAAAANKQPFPETKARMDEAAKTSHLFSFNSIFQIRMN